MLRHKAQANVLVILCDQLRHDAVGYINPAVSTPNIDKLAAQSLICTRAYTQSPQCQPSRASLLTGKHVTGHRVWANGHPLPLTEQTFGNHLRKAGYYTAYFGKAHLVTHHNGDPDVISRFGFDYSHLVADWDLAVRRGIPAEQQAWEEYREIMQGPFWTGKFTAREHHHDERIIAEAIDFVHRTKRPYLAVVSFLGPHPPYAAPPPFCNQYDPKSFQVPRHTRSIIETDHTMSQADWRLLKSQYYGAISWIDDNIGRLLAAIDPNTVVIFTADHGDILGDHGHFSKGLFAYDGVVRVPLLVRAGATGKYDGIVQLIDLCPTIVDLAMGYKLPGVHGVSLRPVIEQRADVNSYALSMMGNLQDWRLRMYVDVRNKYWICNQREFLFNCGDPDEDQNLAADEEQEVRLNRYRFFMLKALMDADDPTPMPD